MASLLAADGQHALYETQPLLEMFDPTAPDPFTPSVSYFGTEPHRDEGTIAYDGSTAAGSPASPNMPIQTAR